MSLELDKKAPSPDVPHEKFIDGVDEKVAINESALPWHKVVSFPKETVNEESIVIINESDTAGHGPIGSSVVIINVAS